MDWDAMAAVGRIARAHGIRGQVIGIEGVETMNDAEGLAGLELRVPLEELAPLPDGMFYHHELIGCQVETVDGEKVEGTLEGSRLVVAGKRGEILIPMATAICRTIDVAGKRIVIEPPDGLLDLN